MSNQEDSIYDDEDAVQENRYSEATVATKVVNLLHKRKPVVLFILGDFNWSAPLPVVEFESDLTLLGWVKDVIDTGCVILHCSDDKLATAEKVCDVLHFNPFLIEGVPEHEMSGLAYNMTHHLSVLSHADVEHIAGFVGVVNLEKDDLNEDEAMRLARESEE